MPGRPGRFFPGRLPEIGREDKPPRSYSKKKRADPESLWVCIRCRCTLPVERRIGSGVNATCAQCIGHLEEFTKAALASACRKARISVKEYHSRIATLRHTLSARVAQRIRAALVWRLRTELDVTWKLIGRLVGYRTHASAIEAFKAERRRRHKLLLR